MEIDTERLTIRTLRRGEGGQIAAYFRENRAFLQPFYPLFRPEDFEDAAWEQLIPVIQRDADEGRAVRSCLFRDGHLIGVANLTGISARPRHACTIGYSLAESAQGCGYMREALAALIPWAFFEYRLHRIEANYMPRNMRSAKVLESLGFQQEGLARAYLMIAGVWEDHVTTALINERWRAE